MQLQSLFGKTVRGAVLAAAVAALCAVGCKDDEKTAASSTPTTGTATTTASSDTPAGASDKPVSVGFLYVGTKDDYGYNQAMADGAAAVKALPGVTVIEQEKVPETMAAQQVMGTMIDQSDASLIFATSFGYFKPHVLQVAPKYPKATFLHAGGLVGDSDPKNVGTFFAYIDELEWLCGMAAGYATKTNNLGYVAAKPIPPVMRDINAFELGAKSVNPSAKITVIFTGDWFLPDKEADAVNSLANAGVDVVSGHIDSPKVMIQTAEKRGIYSCGYHYNCSALAPKGYLTGAEWNWGPMMTRFVNDYKAGKPMPKNFMGSVRDGSVKLSPFGPAVSKDAQDKIAAVEAEMVAGKFNMFKGPLKDNKGNLVIPEGKVYDDQDLDLWKMNYLVEGAQGGQ